MLKPYVPILFIVLSNEHRYRFQEYFFETSQYTSQYISISFLLKIVFMIYTWKNFMSYLVEFPPFAYIELEILVNQNLYKRKDCVKLLQRSQITNITLDCMASL